MSIHFKNLLPGVPFVESPFFERIFSDPAIDEETRRIARDLNENGFAVFDSQVTHYYFEGCAYYRPFRSDPFYGSIYFSKMTDMLTGEPVRHYYNGFEIPKSFIESMYNNCGAQRAVIPPDFDPAQYLLANPDVAKVGEDPVLHYRLHGWREGRRLRP
ncbi:hypothetical protein BJG93_08595 [Paraburkholderia sprentiae WSM5005]|uniref:Uncharacterized protein n=1 Tax=Paraburkholderia sprentiae WSM5005 TaxID=754502 RepID=A0A8F4KI94_9BURK|nr:hypothetical protein [Paraburkholderia sprentiae]QXE07175.1 hypothetical protein BJG93_08595 [Paraburkholderia sprentiae WSM5005]